MKLLLSLYVLIIAIFFFDFADAQENIVNYEIPEKDNDYGGNDESINGNVGINVANAALCAAQCEAIPNKKCIGFVYWSKPFIGDMYGHKAVTIQAGSCYPKFSMKTPTTFQDADVYAYRSVLRSSASTIGFSLCFSLIATITSLFINQIV